MSHAIWKGHISFGLVNIPVVLYSAEKRSSELHFKLLDKRNLGKIRYERINEETGKEVPWEEIGKGYEYEKDHFVLVEKEDFEKVAEENLKLIEIENFIPFIELEPPFLITPYYLLPDKRGEKGYVLLREILKKNHKVGIARVMIRSRQYLCAIIPYYNAILLNTLRYPHEIKSLSEFEFPDKKLTEYRISKKEIEIADQLVSTMSTPWKPKEYKDEYYDNLLKLIEQKVASGGKKVKTKTKTKAIKQTNVIDFMDLLKKSLKEKEKKGSAKISKEKSKPKKSKRK